MVSVDKTRSWSPPPSGNTNGVGPTPPLLEVRPAPNPPTLLGELSKTHSTRSIPSDSLRPKLARPPDWGERYPASFKTRSGPTIAKKRPASQEPGAVSASDSRLDKRYPLAPPVPTVLQEFFTRTPNEEAASTGVLPASAPTPVATLAVPPSILTMKATEADLPQGDAQEKEEAVKQQIGVLHQLLGNAATAPGIGWAANMLHAVGREGTITYLTTATREVVGQLVAQKLERAPDHLKVSVSASIIAATGMLNALIAIKQHTSGQTNWMTRSAQATNIALLGAAAGIAAKTGGLGSAAPLLVKATAYSIARDGINLFVRLNENRAPTKEGVNGRAVFTDMAIYGANQIAVNELQGLGAAFSGTSGAAQAESARNAFGHVSAFSAANAAGETFDALVFPALTGFYDNLGNGIRAALKGVRDVRLATRVHVPFGKDVINNWAGRDLVGRVTKDDLWNKATGAMLGRESLFVILYTLIDAISKAGPAAGLNPKSSEHLTNAVAGLSIGLMLASFVGMVSASPRPAASVRDPETGLLNGGLRASLDLPETEQPRRPSHSVEHP
jgi:hypothetical protein